MLDLLQQDGELVTTETGDGVRGPDGGLDPGADLVEKLVAGSMTEQVVDPLEPVEVAEQHGELAAAADLQLHGVLDPVHEERTVRQTGQRVVPRQMGHVLTQPEAGKGVFRNRDERGQSLPVVPGRRASPVQCRTDNPQLLTTAMDSDPDLGAARWLGAKADPLVAQEVAGADGESLHDSVPVRDGLHPHGGVEQDLQAPGMFASTRLRT